jgi:hypothetical protein
LKAVDGLQENLRGLGQADAAAVGVGGCELAEVRSHLGALRDRLPQRRVVELLPVESDVGLKARGSFVNEVEWNKLG